VTGREIFVERVPELLATARAGVDHRIGVHTRDAVRELQHYECPIGLKLGDAWVFVVAEKLETPNRFRAHWSLQNGARAKWEKGLRAVICAALGVASWEGLQVLGRRPTCTTKMALQIVRLVASSRQFIRDDDNLAFSRKGATDAMKRTGLLKDDRREWLTARSIYQDVAPAGHPLTVFYLWPDETAGLFEGVPHVHRRVHPPAHPEGHAPDRGAEEGRAVPRVRRRVGARAVDV
jgi:hypothetical protein